MTKRETTPFEITKWEQEAVDEHEAGPVVARATVHKTYRGDVAGTAVAQLLLCGELAYHAVERVTGTVGGRAGTFVLVHGATTGVGSGEYASGLVVPGSGSGELVGLTGTIELRHDDAGTRITMEYEVPA